MFIIKYHKPRKTPFLSSVKLEEAQSTPLENMDSIRLVLAIAASKQWKVHHIDMKSEFIHGDMK